MAVRVTCPACRAGLVVHNAKYLVVLHCHACGHEFLAEGPIHSEASRSSAATVVEAYFPDEAAKHEDGWSRVEEDQAVLMFCPMCGELAPESSPECPACGEPLPEEGVGNKSGGDLSSLQARRFRRQAQLLGLLWMLLGYLLLEQDFWLGQTRLALPEVISSARIAIPSIPVMSSVLVGLGAFALAGQFWAVAVGGLLNYLILFIMVWQANVISLVLLAAAILLTHVTLHQASAARFR